MRIWTHQDEGWRSRSRTAGWWAYCGHLLSPGPHPVVILVPGLDSAKEELGATEQLFLDRGLATFAVDGPGQGEAEYDLPIRSDWEVPGSAVIDALEQLPEVDPTRIGAWGVSLGGYYAAADR